MNYHVHIGYTAKGNDRYKRFNTLEEATKFVGSVFDATRIMLSITEEPRP